MCVQGHDPLSFSFRSFFLFFEWVGVLWPQLSKVLKLVRWASSGRVTDEIKRSRDQEEGGGAGPSHSSGAV